MRWVLVFGSFCKQVNQGKEREYDVPKVRVREGLRLMLRLSLWGQHSFTS